MRRYALRGYQWDKKKNLLPEKLQSPVCGGCFISFRAEISWPERFCNFKATHNPLYEVGPKGLMEKKESLRRWQKTPIIVRDDLLHDCARPLTQCWR
ncbi:hypothetical protein K737_301074 [Holospora undulata HU1]|uniref:Uncharacterized protein n=1 Tax=Holospora undulata HU1 TaxID=1321371 RepID=A0A061JGY0_9PROT|nr:hypothetical protein K737_301074 [Holospora undulata HU1]